MSAPLLLDTNVCIWLTEGKLKKSASDLLLERWRAGDQIYVSPYVAWELAAILSLGKLRSSLDATTYFGRLMSQPGLILAELPPHVLIASWSLPGSPPRDPADRIMAATARAFGLALFTSDRALLAYAREGYLSAVPY